MTTKTDTNQPNSATANRSLYLADNLEVLEALPSGSFDLIYVDNSYEGAKFWRETDSSRLLRDRNKKVWKAVKKSKAFLPDEQVRYTYYMAIRLLEMNRVLKESGWLFFYWSHSQPADTDREREFYPYEGLEKCLEALPMYECFGKSITLSAGTAEDGRSGANLTGSLAGYHKTDVGLLDDTTNPPPPEVGTIIDEDDWDILAGEQPVTLMNRVIHLTTPADGAILDPFVGSGTTCLAAENLGRQWVAVDNREAAIARTERRLAERGVDVKHATEIPKRNELNENSCV